MNEKSFLGLRYWFENYSVTQTEENKALSSGKIIGTGLNRTSGLGPIYNFDSRDHIFYPGRGKLIDVGFQFFNKRLGSDFNFQNFTIDASSYFTITKTQILALNLYSVNTIGKEIPFNQLALLGGNKKMRGYLEGRFRDKNLLSIGAEYRFKLFKRFGACLFANAGEVYHSGIELFKFIKPSLGSGLRYQINKAEKINIRLDYAIGPGQSAFYLTLGEAF